MNDEERRPAAQQPTTKPKDVASSRSMTVVEVARELSVSARTALDEVRNMPGAFRVGRLWRVTRAGFEAWLKRRQDEAEWRRTGSVRLSAPPSTGRSWTQHTMPRTKTRRGEPDSWTRPIVPRTKPRKT